MVAEIWTAYLERLTRAAPWMLVAAVLLAAALAVTRYADRALAPERPTRGLLRAVPWVSLSGALLVGTWLAYQRRSLFDDAFISFRFVENFLHGHGLVWNLNERVEGYTNFLWVMIVAGVSAITGREPAEAGFWASLAVFPCSLWTIFRLERALAASAAESAGRPAWMLPLATVLAALQDSFVTAGTTGLETGFAALLVALGTLRLVRARTAVDWACTGLYFILAALTRPDHALFYAVAALLLAWEQARLLAQLGRAAVAAAMKRVLAFSAPFLLYAAHTAWRLSFYGEWLPNTYYVKAADGSYYSQGLLYAATFYLGSHLWLLLPAIAAYVVWPARDATTRRFKRFVGIAFVLYNVYVLKVGGDFMYGRFYVTLVPLLLVALARAVHDLLDARRQVLGYVLATSLAATAGGVAIIAPAQIQWGISDEHTFYRVTSTHPITVDHSNYRIGKTLRKWRDAGLHLRVSTSGIGMVGYYSRMEVIDLMGLTDATIARTPVKKRGRPGHEKAADPLYIEQRMPHLVRGKFHSPRHETAALFEFGSAIAARPWYIYHYDAEVMSRLSELAPTVRFKPFDAYITRYIKHEAPKHSRDTLRRDDQFFKRFYFDHNDDPYLLGRWSDALARARSR